MPEDKLIYTIGDAARLIDVKPYVLRYWETEFNRLNPEKSLSGQRCYRENDLRMALTIKRLLHGEKFTIAGARQKLEELGEDGLDQLNIFGGVSPNHGLSEDLEPLPDAIRSTSPKVESVIAASPEPKTPLGRPALIQSGEEDESHPKASTAALRGLLEESLEILRKYP